LPQVRGLRKPGAAVRHHAGGERDRREIRHSLRQWRVGPGQSHRARFQWFFRTTPVAGDFAEIYLDFLKEMRAAGQKTDTMALVHENTEYGTSVANVISGLFKENGLAIALDIA
jgi:hypothetical protein